METYKDGDIVEITLKLKVVETKSNSCEGCFFYEKDIPCEIFNIGTCDKRILVEE